MPEYVELNAQVEWMVGGWTRQVMTCMYKTDLVPASWYSYEEKKNNGN